jgi:flagellar hook protein FlgE
MDVYNAANADPTTGGFPYTPAAPMTTGNFLFDVSATGKGALDAASPATSLSVTIPGGSPFTIDLSKMTQVASPFQFTAQVDGNAPSAIESVEIAKDGTVSSIFQNGTRLATYRIPLATVASPDKLDAKIGNAYTVGMDSGNLQIDFPGQSGLGQIGSGELEQSNADLASELTSMIEAQRGFTANSKVFQTGDDLLEVLVNLKR